MFATPSQNRSLAAQTYDHASLSLEAARPQGQGLLCGTGVATRDGWRPVEDLLPGDAVLTLSGGFRDVAHVQKRVLWPDGCRVPSSFWPVTLPASTMGNVLDIDLLPAQQVVVEPAHLEADTTGRLSIVSAISLEGVVETERRLPRRGRRIVKLQFLDDEMIYIDGDLLVPCPRHPISPRSTLGAAENTCRMTMRAPLEVMARAA